MRIEGGHQFPTPATVEKLAGALGLDAKMVADTAAEAYTTE